MTSSMKLALETDLESAKQELISLRNLLGIKFDDPVPGTSRNFKLTINKINMIQESNPLPDGWKEMIDSSSGQIYYVNRITKERQSKRPLVSNTDVKTSGSNNNNNSSNANIDTKMLLTKSSSVSNAGPSNTSDDVKEINRFSKRFSANDLGKLQSLQNMKASTPSILASPIVLTREAKIAHARGLIASISVSPSIIGKVTISRMESVGSLKKTGYLMKQSKLLLRWIKRYFILSENRIEYYDDETLSNGKECLLKGDTIVSYTSKENCFCIKGLVTTDRLPADEWNMMADGEDIMEDWIAALNSHIHIEFKKENDITKDYWEDGEIATSFWKVPYSTPDFKRIPIGIRTVPMVNGPRTNEGIFPGETVEIVQTIVTSENTFLRLADDRGWIFETHPKEKYALFEKVKGEYIEDSRVYNYSITHVNSLNLFTGPCCSSDVIMPVSISPGNIISTCATWSPNDPEEYDFPMVFVKLTEERAWVTVYDVDTGKTLLERLK